MEYFVLSYLPPVFRCFRRIRWKIKRHISQLVSDLLFVATGAGLLTALFYYFFFSGRRW